MRKKTISGFSRFDTIRVPKFDFGSKINRASVLANFFYLVDVHELEALSVHLDLLLGEALILTPTSN